ncbi:MAG: acyl-CoA dehydrogenase [Calditrichaeota bacterium]|nr:MAG: acyl-CoA dehydrogenase [Calditrichota bacterium]MBL1204289.1 acyl-CoA dehydrogenase [Calditrichota bacterium]NOG44119.1 acyl-CoA dehydrogenase [Calditrichota bacterium]
MIKFTEEHEMVRKMVRDFAQKEMAPIAIEIDENERFAEETFKKMADLHLLGLPVSEKYGGAGFDLISYAITLEEFAKVCASTTLSYSAHISLCSTPIEMFGTEEQKLKYLVPLAKGEKLGAFGLTEPGAGSDAGGTQTTAEEQEDHYLINGSKVFITNAEYAEIFVVTAVTNKGKGARGVSSFILEKDMAGFEIGKKEKKLGMRGSPTSMLHFTNVKVPKENLLGKKNEGYKQFLMTLDGGRIGIAAQSLGIAKAAYEKTMQYAHDREQFGKKLIDFQATQFKIADMVTKIMAAEELIYNSISLRNENLPHKKEASIAKLFTSEAAMDITKEAIQIHGGYGYVQDYEVERYWRDAKLMEIGEGTSEVQRMVIFREALKEFSHR